MNRTRTRNIDLFMLLIKNKNLTSHQRRNIQFSGKLLTKEEAKKEELQKIAEMDREQYMAYREIKRAKARRKKEGMVILSVKQRMDKYSFDKDL